MPRASRHVSTCSSKVLAGTNVTSLPTTHLQPSRESTATWDNLGHIIFHCGFPFRPACGPRRRYPSAWPHAVVPTKSAAGSAESRMDTEGYFRFARGLGRRAGSR